MNISPEVAAEIARIIAGTASVRTGIQAKGVAVPPTAQIDALSTYIAQISGGAPAPPSVGLFIKAMNASGFPTQLEFRGTTIPTSYFNAVFFRQTQEIDLIGNVSIISQLAFAENAGLISLDLPQSLTSLRDRAMDGCTGLAYTELNLPNATVESRSFQSLTAMRTLKAKIKQLGASSSANSDSFYRCTGLRYVWISEAITTRIYGSASAYPFLQCNAALKIYTDVASDANRPANWSEHWNRISASDLAETHYGVSEAQFESIVNAAYGETIY